MQSLGFAFYFAAHAHVEGDNQPRSQESGQSAELTLDWTVNPGGRNTDPQFYFVLKIGATKLNQPKAQNTNTKEGEDAPSLST